MALRGSSSNLLIGSFIPFWFKLDALGEKDFQTRQNRSFWNTFAVGSCVWAMQGLMHTPQRVAVRCPKLGYPARLAPTTASLHRHRKSQSTIADSPNFRRATTIVIGFNCGWKRAGIRQFINSCGWKMEDRRQIIHTHMCRLI